MVCPSYPKSFRAEGIRGPAPQIHRGFLSPYSGYKPAKGPSQNDHGTHVCSDLKAEEHLEILRTVGVVRIVSFRSKPVPASEEEISSLMILDGTDRTVQNQDFMKKGDRVMIMEGPLKGLIGYYLRHKAQSDKVVVTVELLKRSLAVEIEGWALEKIEY